MLTRFLVNRNYARMWYGQAISGLGDVVFDTTLVLWVATVLGKGQRWAPTAVSGVLLAAGATFLVVGPLAGVIADRWDRRRLMLRTEAIRAVLAGGMTLLFLLPVRALPVWAWLTVIYVVVFALNCAGQFFNPARFALTGDIVPGEVDRTRAIGLGQATFAATQLIGPPLAAPLLFSVGVQYGLALNALSYVVSYFAVRSVRPEAAKAGTPAAAPPAAGLRALRGELAAGLRFFASSRFLIALAVVGAIISLGTGSLNTLDVFFVTRNLHAPARLFGVLAGAAGLGTVIGSLLAGRAVALLGARRLTCAAIGATGVLVLAFAQQRTFGAGLALMFVLCVPAGMVNTAIGPLLLAETPPEFRGRMLAVLNPVIQLAALLSMAVSGPLAASVLEHVSVSFAGLRFNPISIIFTAAGLLILAGAGYAVVALPRERAAAPVAESPAAEPPGTGPDVAGA